MALTYGMSHVPWLMSLTQLRLRRSMTFNRSGVPADPGWYLFQRLKPFFDYQLYELRTDGNLWTALGANNGHVSHWGNWYHGWIRVRFEEPKNETA